MSIFNKQDRLNARLGRMVFANTPVREIEGLIANGADPNAKRATDYDGTRSVLYWAVYLGKHEVVETLLKHGAKTDPEDEVHYHDSALHRAISQGRHEMMKILLNAGADKEAPGYNYQRPLSRAAERGDAEAVKMLVKAGADINGRGSGGNTALHVVAEKGMGDMVRLLLDLGADITVPNGNMNTAADVARKDYPRIAEMISGIAAPVPAPVTAPAPESDWALTAVDEVARVLQKSDIGYRLTEIFNFGAHLYTQIARNIETGAESQTVKGFSELDDGRAVAAARAALEKLGGRELPPTIDKKKYTAPGAA